MPEWDSPSMGNAPAAEDQVLLGVESRRPRRRAAPPLPRVPLGGAGGRAGRIDDQGGRTAAGGAREHREDPAPPRQGPAARLAGRAAPRGKVEVSDHDHPDLARRRVLFAAYVAGALDPINGASVEQHLDRCEECRLAIRPLVEPQRSSRPGPGSATRSRVLPLPLPARVARASRCLGLHLDPARRDRVARTAWLASAFVALASRRRQWCGRTAAPSARSCWSHRWSR